MATLAQINDTLKDQTSSIEDGTETTAGLRERFGKFLDRQQGSGDKREIEIEARQKERRQRVMASRPTSFTQGVTQGLGFGGGLGFGAIAQKIMAGMGIAAGAIGLGAGKLLRFGPAILALSDFGEKAIRGMVDYIDEEIEGVDFKEETKKRLTQGGQAAIAAKLLGAKGLFGPAIAGVIGAYGDTAIEKFNSFFGKKDGKYNIPLTDIEIDTQTDSFKTGMAAALGLAAGPLLRFTGGVLAAAIAMLPATRFTKLVLGAVTAMFGLKGVVGTALKDSVNKRYDAKQMMKINEVIPRQSPIPKVTGAAVTVSKAANFNRGFAPANVAANSSAPPTNPKKVPPRTLFNVPLKVHDLTGVSQSLKKAAGAVTNVDNAMNAMKLSTKALTKIATPLGFAYGAYTGQSNPHFTDVEMDPFSKGVAGGATELVPGTLDFIQHMYAFGNNKVNEGVNYALRGLFGENSYQLGMMGYSNMTGASQKAIARGYVNYLDNSSSSMIAASQPSIGLQPGAGAGLEADTKSVVVDGSSHLFNDNSIKIIGFGQTMDMGSKVVSIGN